MANLVALSDIRSELRLETAETTDDAQITIIAAEVSAFVDAYIDRVLASASYTEIIEAEGGRMLLTRQYPVTAVSAVKIGGVGGFDFADITAEPTDYYRIDQSALGIVHRSEWGCREFVQVAYTAGYTSFPADLVGLARRLGARRYRGYAERIQHLTNRSGIDGTSVGYIDMITDNDRAILDRHRRWSA